MTIVFPIQTSHGTLSSSKKNGSSLSHCMTLCMTKQEKMDAFGCRLKRLQSKLGRSYSQKWTGRQKLWPLKKDLVQRRRALRLRSLAMLQLHSSILRLQIMRQHRFQWQQQNKSCFRTIRAMPRLESKRASRIEPDCLKPVTGYVNS